MRTLYVGRHIRKGYSPQYTKPKNTLYSLHQKREAKEDHNPKVLNQKEDTEDSAVISKNKMDPVFSAFKKFKALVEAQSGCILKKLSLNTNLHCVIHPQQNRVAERENRSILDMGICMIFEKKLPKFLWKEAINTVVYLQNRLPTKAVKGMTVIEAWGGIKPSIKHLRVFGSLCYTYVPYVKRSKLDEKTERGVLIDYSSKSKGYKVYSIDSGKNSVSKDVKVDEDTYLNWETTQVDMHSILPYLGSTNEDQEEEVDDDFAVRGTKPLLDIHHR
ncbi:hypothetical protein CR513_40708, partial [Mucuna pruriens]